MTTPIEQVEELRQKFLKDIDTFFSENEIKSIDFEPKENDLDIEPYSLNNEGVLTLIDEGGMDYDEKLNTLHIQTVALILDLIQSRSYDISE